MSDDTIRPGDLVRIVPERACCSAVLPIAGLYFTVDKVDYLMVRCSHCGWRAGIYRAWFNERGPSGQQGYAPVGWLKKVPPLRDSEAADELLAAPVLPEAAHT